MEKDDGENEEMTERMKEFGSMERDDGCWGGGGISVGIPPVRKLKLPPPLSPADPAVLGTTVLQVFCFFLT